MQRAPLPSNEQDCKREKVVAALMFWSDSTHLANFGTAKLWPIYLLFGNVSKYIRGQPSSGACQHVAYIPSLPDSFQDFATNFCRKWGTQKADIMMHCRRELMHGVWRFLLDKDFIHAYRYGMVVKCADGVGRRVYPRIFTYSADYPEKWVIFFVPLHVNALSNSVDRVLLATIRNQGLHPCPRCLIPKAKLDETGMKHDNKFRLKNVRSYLFDFVLIARKAIYNLGAAIAGEAVNQLLKTTSSVPTVVSQDPFNLYNSHSFKLRVSIRMLLLINLALISTSCVCSLSTFCMSLNWVCGKHSLPI